MVAGNSHWISLPVYWLPGCKSGEGSAAVQLTPPLSWVAVTLLAMALGHYARGWRLSLFVGACFCYLVVFGQWGSAMLTLSSVLIAVPIGVTGGVLLGILAFRQSLDGENHFAPS